MTRILKKILWYSYNVFYHFSFLFHSKFQRQAGHRPEEANDNHCNKIALHWNMWTSIEEIKYFAGFVLMDDPILIPNFFHPQGWVMAVQSYN